MFSSLCSLKYCSENYLKESTTQSIMYFDLNLNRLYSSSLRISSSLSSSSPAFVLVAVAVVPLTCSLTASYYLGYSLLVGIFYLELLMLLIRALGFSGA